MHIQFPIDNKLLGDLLYDLVKSNIEPKFIVGYTIEEDKKKKYKNELIEISERNAKDQAEILAKSAEVKLGKIIAIDYSDIRYDFYEEVQDFSDMGFMQENCNIDEGYDFDIEADDISISDSVNMVWEIE